MLSEPGLPLGCQCIQGDGPLLSVQEAIRHRFHRSIQMLGMAGHCWRESAPRLVIGQEATGDIAAEEFRGLQAMVMTTPRRGGLDHRHGRPQGLLGIALATTARNIIRGLG